MDIGRINLIPRLMATLLCLCVLTPMLGAVVASAAAEKGTASQESAAMATDQSTGDVVNYATLQDAISNAGDGQVITLLTDVAENITSSDKDYTLDLNGHTIDGGNAATVFTIQSGTVTLKNGTIMNGNAGTNADGGGIKIAGGSVSICDVSVTGNQARRGGGIYIMGGSVSIEGGTVSDNSAVLGGGIGTNNVAGHLTITDATVSNNTVTTGGGGMYVTAGPVTIQGGMFTGNSAISGSAIYVNTDSSLDMSSTRITGNPGPTNDYGIVTVDGAPETSFLPPGTLSADGVEFTENTGSDTGCVLQADGPCDLTGCSFSGNIGFLDNVRGGEGTSFTD